MEGIAAFAIVGNVMQVIDMAGKVTSWICQISRQGTTSDNAELEEHSILLANITKTLVENLLLVSTNRTQSSIELELRKLAESCCATVEELQMELSKLKAKGGRFDVLQKSLKAIRCQPTIENIQKRLSEHQTYLHSGLLVRLSQELDILAVSQTEEFHHLSSDVQQLFLKMEIAKNDIVERITSESVAEHATTQAQIRQEFDNFKSDATNDAQRHKLLSSLYFGNMNARHNQVSDSADHTFEWVLDDAPGLPSSSLRDWFQQGEYLYWIQGKPGSGKSTLVKFIIENEKTLVLLTDWGMNRRPRILSHFFWLAGSDLQKNLHGFLRSMLYQVLHEDKHLTEWLIKTYSGLFCKHNFEEWNTKQLMTMLLEVLQESKHHTTYCIFLDGFDEFDDPVNFEKQVDLLYTMASFENIKICISSRPVSNLRDVFHDVPNLKLQDLTWDDIYRYVQQGFEKMRFGLCSVYDLDSIDSLINQIVSKAEGVFLWVRVVLHDVRRGLRNQDSMEQLQTRISRLPSDLYELYEDMLRRIGSDWQIYLKEAAFYLKLCYMSTKFGTSLCTLTMTHASDMTQDLTTTSIRAVHYGQEFFERCRRIETRVISCCGGMLEISKYPDLECSFTPQVSENDYYHYFWNSTTVFCHRTVLDFLETPSGMDILKESCIDEIWLFFAKLQRDLSTLANFDIPDTGSDAMCVRRHYEYWYDKAMRRMSDISERLLPETHIVQRGIVMVDKAFMEILLSHGIGIHSTADHQAYWAHLSYRNEFVDVFGCRLSHGLSQGLFDSSDSHSDGCPIVLSKITRKYASYLLYCAVGSGRSCVEACNRLLNAGADPNASIVRPTGWSDHNKYPWLVSPWIHLLNAVTVGCYVRGRNASLDPAFESVLTSFLSHGARLDQKILYYGNNPFPLESAIACYTKSLAFASWDIKKNWAILAATTTGEVLRRILKDLNRDDLIRKYHLSTAMDRRPQRYLVALAPNPSTDGECNQEVIKLNDADSCMIIRKHNAAKRGLQGVIDIDCHPISRIYDDNGNSDDELRSEDEEKALYDIPVEGLLDKYEVVEMSSWLRQEGWIVDGSDADIPRKFHRRFQDDEEGDESGDRSN